MAPSEIDIKEAVEFTANLVQPFATPTNDIQEVGWKKVGKRRKDCIKEKWHYYVKSPSDDTLRSYVEVRNYLERNPNINCDHNVTNTNRPTE